MSSIAAPRALRGPAEQNRPAALPARLALFAYGIAAYAGFVASLAWAIAWLGNIPLGRFGLGFLPAGIDAPPRVHWAAAVGIDLGLLLVFALQHSVMARPAFKRMIIRFIPQAAERSTYVMASNAAFLAILIWWQPIGGIIWNFQAPALRLAAWALLGLGVAILLLASFLINHFDLFGLRHVWLFLRNRPYTVLKFATPWLYGVIRHPLYVGWLLIFWATPTMTAAHLVFALATTAYIFIAVRFEERDLIAAHPEYAAYRARTPMLIPRARRA